MAINFVEWFKLRLSEERYAINEDRVRNPIEDDQPLIILGETEIGDKAYGSVSNLPRKFLQKTGISPYDDDWPPIFGYQKGAPQEDFLLISHFEDSGGSKGKESLEFGGWGRSLLASGFESPPDAKHPWEEVVHYQPFEAIKSSPPWGAFYLDEQEAAAANKVGRFHGYEYLPGPPNIGTGNSAGTLGMQGGLMILMFAVCYMLYMILKKRVCSFSIGWKDTDGGGELELGGPRDA